MFSRPNRHFLVVAWSVLKFTVVSTVWVDCKRSRLKKTVAKSPCWGRLILKAAYCIVPASEAKWRRNCYANYKLPYEVFGLTAEIVLKVPLLLAFTNWLTFNNLIEQVMKPNQLRIVPIEVGYDYWSFGLDLEIAWDVVSPLSSWRRKWFGLMIAAYSCFSVA